MDASPDQFLVNTGMNMACKRISAVAASVLQGFTQPNNEDRECETRQRALDASGGFAASCRLQEWLTKKVFIYRIELQ